MRVWKLGGENPANVAIIHDCHPWKSCMDITERSWPGEETVDFVTTLNNSHCKILLEDIMREVVKQTLHGVYYLKGWTLEEGEALAKFISPEVRRRTNGLFFETIAFKTDDGRIGIVGNE